MLHAGLGLALLERGKLLALGKVLHVDLMLAAVTNDGQLEPTSATANDRYVPIVDLA